MSHTYLLLLWLQVFSGLSLSFVLGGLYFSLYREEFLKYWALGYGYGASSLGVALLALNAQPATVLQAHGMQFLALPQYILLAAAALSVAHGNLGRRQIRLLAGLAIAAVAVEIATGLIVPDIATLRGTLRLERHLMGAGSTGWFCLALWRKYPFATTLAGRITLFFAALQSLHNLVTAYPPVYATQAALLGAVLPFGMAAGAFLLILQTSNDSNTALRASEDRYRRLLTTSPDAFTMSSLDGKLVLCNQRAVELFGYSSPEELAGRSCRSMIAASDQEIVEQYIAEVLQGVVIRSRMLRCRRKDGSEFAGEVSATMVKGHDGKPDGWMAFTRDISKRIADEEAQASLQEQLRHAQKMESIGRLAGGVAHDFNNILTVINGYSDLAIRRLNPDGTMLGYLKQIRRSGEQAAALTRQLLAFSRKQIIQPAPLDLRVSLTGSADMLRRLVGEDVELVTVFDPDTALVLADPVQIEQVVMNLAINGRDAMPKGGRLTIAVGNIDLETEKGGPPAGKYVRLSIADTGMGIDEETREHLFEPFFTTKDKGKGTGLGLSTVYGIVQQSQGWIRVESGPGQGSIFKIYLPRLGAEGVPMDVRKPHAADQRGSETLLLVEDQDELRQLAKSVLDEQGYRVLEAADGEQALEVGRKFSGAIDLLVTDIVLPGINGKQLAEQFGTSRRDMKVLYMSGYSDDVIAHSGVLYRGVAYMQKPFTPVELAEKVREVLAKKLRRILIADDEPAVRSLLEEVLTEAGYQVLAAANGQEAMEIVRTARPHLVITDLVMPHQEGVETIQMIRKEFPAIKIVAMSGALGGQFLRGLGRLGADASLTKPVSPESLQKVVGDLLG
jgi:two-component system, cell cycle sensor histidine kinase and response regulator CckA